MDIRLQADTLSKQFGGYAVLRDVSLELRRGEIVLLRGDNGSGKTTLLDILSGQLAPTSGVIRYFDSEHGHPLSFSFDTSRWRMPKGFSQVHIARLGFARAWQDLRLFPTHTLTENIALAIPHHEGEGPFGQLLHPWQARAQEATVQKQTLRILDRLGLPGRGNSTAERISLGQARRVAIARAIQTGARVLFLDEPLSSLDREGVMAVTTLLREIRNELDSAMVIVEHPLNVSCLLGLATTVWTLAEGHLHAQRPEEIADEPAGGSTDIQRALVLGCMGQRSQFTVQELAGGAILTTVIPADTAREVVLRVEDLVVKRGRRAVIGAAMDGQRLRGLSFDLIKGCVHLLEAPNGWGKTTLLEALAGLLPLDRGQIVLAGHRINNTAAWQRARLGLKLLRSRSSLFPDLTIQETMRLAGKTRLNGLTGLPQTRRVSTLSGGERQKLALECSPTDSAAVALFDEPFAALDRKGLKMALDQLLPRRDSAVLVALPSARQED